MLRHIDEFLNSITMYRAVLYGLLLLVLCVLIASPMKAIPYSPFILLGSLGLIVTTSAFSNYIFAKIFKVPTNIESYLITALILFFIITPSMKFPDGILPLILAPLIAIASKFIFTIKRRHIFNPVAIGAVGITLFGMSASWWIATPVLLPAVFIIGFFVIRKVRKFSLVFAFLGIVIGEMLIFGMLYNTPPVTILTQLMFSWPILFFAAFMLTEPLTMPPTRYLQILYGALVGFLFAFQLPLDPIKLSPELVLVIGNIFAYIVSFKQRATLILQEKQRLSSTLYNFVFQPQEKFSFLPGQYAEWTLPHKKTDSRGNRRFFSIASSPTEQSIQLGVRIDDDSSSFKKALREMQKNEKIVIGNLKGDFVLPNDTKEKLAFLSGGIGVTPFRSMLKYLTDRNEKRDIVYVYTCSKYEDFIYDNILEEAKQKLRIKIIYILKEDAPYPKNYEGYTGHFTEEILEKEIPDYNERKYYISGSHQIVELYKDVLKKSNIRNSNIVTDYFSGY